MADSLLVELAPVDLHLQVQENEDSSILQPLPPHHGYNTFARDSFEQIEGDHDQIQNALKSHHSNFGYLWRKYGEGQIGNCHRHHITDGAILGPHEMPVCGTNVDERIVPGFKYRVRILGRKTRDRFQFGGKALHLERVGQGYGKRLTFESPSANDNPNYFWSDTHPDGYVFVISVVHPGDEFVLCQQNRRPFGQATVVATSPDQVEIGSVIDGKTVVKRVLVSMCIAVRYTCEPHGMMSLRANEVLNVTGVAVVTRGPKSKAVTHCIEEILIPGHGECLLYKEDD